MGRSKVSLFLGAAALLAGSSCGTAGSTDNFEAKPDAQSANGGGPSTNGAVASTNGAAASTSGVAANTNGAATSTSGAAASTSGAASGAATGTSGAATGLDGSGKKVVDPTGVWWTEIETKGKQMLPTVGLLEGTDISFVMRVEIEGTGPSQTAKFEFCTLQTIWANPLLSEDVHIIGFRPETTATFGETLSVDFSGLSVGSKVPIPDLTFIGGGDETGAIFDEDGDGFPAVTAFVRIILPFEVAEVITIKAKLDLEAADEDTLSGTLDFNAEATIIDSNSAGFVPAGFHVTIDPDSDAVPITVHRLPGGGDCSTIPTTILIAGIPDPLGDPIDPIVGPQSPPASNSASDAGSP